MKKLIIAILMNFLLSTPLLAVCEIWIDGQEYCNFVITNYTGVNSTPNVSNIGEARIYFDPISGKLQCSEDGAAYVDCVGSGGGGTPGGSDTQIQFNDGGSSFLGDSGLTFNKTTDVLTVGAGLIVTGQQPASVSSASATAATDIIVSSDGTGGNTTIATTGTGGIGSDLAVTLGTGGIASAALTASTGGKGGSWAVNGGMGGNANIAGTGTNTGGAGGDIAWTAGTGGTANGVSSGTNTAGVAGTLTITGGTGGTASTGSGTLTAKNGGAVTISGGTGGVGTSATGNGGLLTLRGGTAGATQGSTGGAVNIIGRDGTSTGTGGNGGAVTIDGGNAAGDGTTNRSGGAITMIGGTSLRANAGGATTLRGGVGGVGSGSTGGMGGNSNIRGGDGGIGSSTGGVGGNTDIYGGLGGDSGTDGSGGVIRFLTTTSSAAQTERMRMTAAGWVGYNDTSPAAPWDFNIPTITLTGSATSYGMIFDASADSSTATSPTFRHMDINSILTGDENVGTFTSLYVTNSNQSTAGTISDHYAIIMRLFLTGDGNTTRSAAIYSDVTKGSGTGTHAEVVNFYADAITRNSGTITDAISFKGVKSVGAVTNSYGLVLDDYTTAVATNNEIGLLIGAKPTGPLGLAIYQNTDQQSVFKGHIEHEDTAPAVSSCGTSPTIQTEATDHGGKVTIGTGGIATSCTLTFSGTAFTAAPACFCNNESQILLCRAVSTTTTVTLSVATVFAASDVVSYGCIASR